MLIMVLDIAFTASHAHLGRELNILLIFMLLILAIVFCHSFVRFVLAIARGPIVINRNRIPSQLGPGGYAEPDRPIPVVLPADEESMAECEGNTREKVAPPPPAYGLWRSSVVSFRYRMLSQKNPVSLTSFSLTENQSQSYLLASCRRCSNIPTE